MVFHALCEQFLPSHRGLARNHESLAAANDHQFWQEHQYHHYGPNNSSKNHASFHHTGNFDNAIRTNATAAPTAADNYRRNNGSILDLDEPNRCSQQESGVHNNNKKKAVTRQKRNHFKTSKFLASLAADFDVVTDWLFYMHCNKANREYYRDNGGDYQIPPILVNLVLLSCIVGTILWLILATDGRIVLPLWRQLGYDKLSLGHVLGATVLLEDLPQVLLTFLIEDYFEEDQTFNNYALINVVASVYDILIKLAEAFDQRADVVETGHWCKESIAAHDKRIVCLVPIPSSRHTDNYNSEGNPTAGETFSGSRNNLEEGRIGPSSQRITSSTRSIATFRNQLHVSNSNLEQQYEQQQQHPNQNELQRPRLHRKKSSRRRSILQEAQEIVADTRLPPMRFLSASKDATVKLWDTAIFDQRTGRNKREPVRTFVGHEKRVSCVAFVKEVDDQTGLTESYTRNEMESKANDQTTAAYYFLTGSYDGTSKLWSTNHVECLKTYSTLPMLTNNDATESIEITCLAYLPILRNEERMSRSATNITFDDYFVNGYKSGKTRLWDLWSGSCLRVFDEAKNMAPSGNNIFSRVYHHRKNRRFKIYSVCSMEDSRHFATGSADGSIRLWDVGSMSPIHEESQATAIEPYVSINDSHGNSMGNTDTPANNTTAILSSTTRNTIAPEVFTTPKGLLVGHTQTVVSIKCVSPGSVLLSGSLDGTAMLWSISTGACLQVFSGHTGPVHGVAVVDQVTVLTASGDGTVKAWDALSGEAFRTYEGGHNSSPVTAVTMGDQSGCFASGAEDGTIGLWIFSAVHDKHHRRMLGVDDDDEIGLFCGCEEDVLEDDDCQNDGVVDKEILNAQGYTRFHSQQ